MKRLCSIYAVAVACALLLGSLFPHGAHGAPSTAAEASQLTFPTGKIHLRNKTLTVEIADNEERREQGLMFRESLAHDHGMLFVFKEEQPLAFWMKNTLIPLSIGYFDKQKKLISVHEMEPAIAGEGHPKTYASSAPAMYALEMPKGWFAQNKVELGTTFSFVEHH